MGRAPVGGLGLQHGKVVLTDRVAFIGSCNWTTASRANVETGVLVVLAASEHKKLKDRLVEVLGAGIALKDAEVLAEQRHRSASPTRPRQASRR